MKNGNVSKFENETFYLDCPETVSGRLQQQVEQAGIAPVNIQPCKLLKNADIYPNGRTARTERLRRYHLWSIKEAQDRANDCSGAFFTFRPKMGIEGVIPAQKLKAA